MLEKLNLSMKMINSLIEFFMQWVDGASSQGIGRAGFATFLETPDVTEKTGDRHF